MNKKTVLCLAVCSALTSIYSVANAETRPSYSTSHDFVDLVFENKAAPESSKEYYGGALPLTLHGSCTKRLLT